MELHSNPATSDQDSLLSTVYFSRPVADLPNGIVRHSDTNQSVRGRFFEQLGIFLDKSPQKKIRKACGDGNAVHEIITRRLHKTY